MNYKNFNLGDWIGHINEVIEDETTLDGNEMRDLVEFLSILKQKSCTDAISRQEAINCVTSNEFRYKIVEDIKTLPSVTPKEKTGHWIDITNKNGTVIAVRCDCCGNSPKHAIKSDFCPNCGVKMVEIKESGG